MPNDKPISYDGRPKVTSNTHLFHSVTLKVAKFLDFLLDTSFPQCSTRLPRRESARAPTRGLTMGFHFSGEHRANVAVGVRVIALLVCSVCQTASGDEISVIKVENLEEIPVAGEIELTPGLRQETLELGDLIIGKSTARRLTLKNQLGHRVKISRIQSSCGCLAAVPIDPSIVDGGQTTMIVKMNPTSTGSFKKQFTIEFEGNDNVFLVVKAQVLATIVLNKHLLDVTADSPRVSIDMRLNTDTDVEIEEVELVSRFVVSEWRPRRGGRSGILHLNTAKFTSLDQGELHQNAIVQLSNGEQERVPFTIRNIRAVQVFPSLVHAKARTGSRARYRFFAKVRSDLNDEIATADWSAAKCHLEDCKLLGCEVKKFGEEVLSFEVELDLGARQGSFEVPISIPETSIPTIKFTVS